MVDDERSGDAPDPEGDGSVLIDPRGRGATARSRRGSGRWVLRGFAVGAVLLWLLTTAASLWTYLDQARITSDLGLGTRSNLVAQAVAAALAASWGYLLVAVMATGTLALLDARPSQHP